MRKEGSVFLEAILSIVLLLGALYCAWAVSLVIYNQTKLNTATQFAAQSALISYDRDTFRGAEESTARIKAARVAETTLEANLRGAFRDQFEDNSNGMVGKITNKDTGNFIACAPNVNEPASQENCSRGAGNAQVTQVHLDTEFKGITFWLFSAMDNNRARNADDQQSITQYSQSNAFSFGPWACYSSINPGATLIC